MLLTDFLSLKMSTIAKTPPTSSYGINFSLDTLSAGRSNKENGLSLCSHFELELT